MALKIGDRVRENTSSTGVGGLSLTGAPAGFQRFSAVLASGDTTFYSLEENDKFEVGIGTYGSNNLERTTVLSSSNSGNKISLGGSGVVFITYPASKAIFSSETDQLVLGASGLLFANGTAVKDAKLVELTDVNLSGTPVQSSVFDLNITNKSLSIGDLTGPTNSNNILIGYGAGSGITTGSDSVIIGAESSTINKTGQHNVHIGAKAGPIVSDASNAVYNSVAVGYSAGNKMRHESVAIGYEAALHAYEIGFVGIGYQVGSGIGSYATAIGYQAGRTLGEDYAVAIGYQAGYNGAGESAVWIGQGAGTSSTGSTRSIGIGKNAGKSSSGTECIYLGEGAGTSNSSNNLVFIGNSTPATNGTLVKGDMDAKRLAVGVADVTLDDTFFVGVNSANDEGIVVKAAVSQVSNLTSWKDSSSNVLASVDKNGIISGHGIHATGNGILIDSSTPASTTNKLYNIGSDLYWNGAIVTAAAVSAIANYASGQAVENESDIVAVSGIAVYSSGQTITNQSNITALNTASGIATSLLAVSGTATSLVATSGIATYASGQAISNQSSIATNTSNISTNTSRVTYASGQAIENESDILAVSGIAAYASGVSLTVKESDGSPNVSNVRTIVVSNGTLTDNGAGQVTVTTGGGGGGGDVTTAQLNYVSGIAVYSSGLVITNEAEVTYASGLAITNEGRVNYASGLAITNEGRVNYASGLAITNEAEVTYASGLAITNEARVNYASGQAIENEGLATYASGQAIENETDIAYVSGIAVYSSGQTIANQSSITALNTASGIATSLLAVSGTATSLVASSGIASYASGQAVSNQANITSNTTNISYVSGVATKTFNITGGDGSNYVIDGMGLNSASDPAIYLHKGHTYYFNKQISGHPFRISTSNGGSAYQDADGNSIEISGQGVLKFEVPQDAPDKLYYYCTSHSSMNGPIYTTNNVDEIIHVSGIAAYASGQAISNQGNITALNTASGIATSLLAVSGTATSLVATSGIATYASGQAIANESDLVGVSGIAAYASGISLTVKEADGSPNVSNVRTIVVSNGTLTDNGAGQVTVTTGGGGGGSSLTAGSGVVVDGADRINIHGGTGNFQEIQLTSANTFTPKMVFTGSGVQDTPITMKALSSHQSATGSGTALIFEGTQGQLFSITDNLSSGTIFSVSDITGLPLIEANASGDVKLAEGGRYILAYGGYVQEFVPASDTPTTEDATITLDLSAGNYHNIVLGANVTKFEFLNAKRGQRFLLRITQHASSAKTIAWTNVDYTSGGAAATVRWAGGGTPPTMSTSTSHTDVYEFLCTNSAGSAFDGFVVGQDLPD